MQLRVRTIRQERLLKASILTGVLLLVPIVFSVFHLVYFRPTSQLLSPPEPLFRTNLEVRLFGELMAFLLATILAANAVWHAIELRAPQSNWTEDQRMNRQMIVLAVTVLVDCAVLSATARALESHGSAQELRSAAWLAAGQVGLVWLWTIVKLIAHEHAWNEPLAWVTVGSQSCGDDRDSKPASET